MHGSYAIEFPQALNGYMIPHGPLSRWLEDGQKESKLVAKFNITPKGIWHGI